MREPAVAGEPFITNTSLIPMGTPARGGSGLTLCSELIDSRGRPERTLAAHRKISINGRILRFNLLKTKLRQLGCAGVCIAHCCLNLGDTSLLPIHNSIIVPWEGSGNQFCLAADLRSWFFERVIPDWPAKCTGDLFLFFGSLRSI